MVSTWRLITGTIVLVGVVARRGASALAPSLTAPTVFVFLSTARLVVSGTSIAQVALLAELAGFLGTPTALANTTL